MPGLLSSGTGRFGPMGARERGEDTQHTCVWRGRGAAARRLGDAVVAGTVAGVDTFVVFLGALLGAGIGAYSGVTVERLRGKHELVLQRRDDIKEGLLAVNERAAAALRICADLQRTEHWPTLYDDDWRTLRAKQLQSQAADMLIALARVELFLADPSTIEQRANEYFDILTSPETEEGQPAERRYAAAAAAHIPLKHALREELARVTAANAGWAGAAGRMQARFASRMRESYPNRRPGQSWRVAGDRRTQQTPGDQGSLEDQDGSGGDR